MIENDDKSQGKKISSFNIEAKHITGFCVRGLFCKMYSILEVQYFHILLPTFCFESDQKRQQFCKNVIDYRKL